MILIVGASGRLGSRVAQRLLDNGAAVRAVSRDPDNRLAMLKSKGAETISGDLRDQSWMDAALKGVQYLFLASHALVPPSCSNSIDSVDDIGNRRIIDGAKRAGVEHVFFTSANLAKPDTPVKFGRIKFKVEEYLKESGLEYTIVRPTAFIETHVVLLMCEPLRRSGKVKLFGKAQTPINWISVENVADYMVKSIDDPEARNAIKVIGGPDTLSRVQALEIIERVLGRKAKRSHIPLGVLHVMKVLSKLFNPGLSYLLEATLAEENPPHPDEWTPAKLDWVAPATVEDVVKRWVNGQM